MLNENDVRRIVGATAYDNDGDKVGKVGQLYLDDQTGAPEFVTVNTGFFGTSESFVPVEGASLDGDDLRLPFSKDKIKDAPNVDIDSGGHLDEAQERRLYEYYGRGYDTGYSTTDTTSTGTTGTTTGTTTGMASEGRDLSGPETDDAMTRSEEHVRVGTASQEAGRVRLRKYVTSETETHTVPVSHERAVLEREPITEGNVGSALDGPAITEEEHEVVLHEEVPVVQKDVTPVERVRLGTETVTEQETVTEEVRKEHIEAEGDVVEGGHVTGTDTDRG